MSKQKKETEISQLEFFKGKEQTFLACDGNEYTIREMNADDDEILTKFSSKNPKADEINNMNSFVQAIVVAVNGNRVQLSLPQVLALKLNAKHQIVLKARILSIGAHLKFSARCPNTDCENNKNELIFNEDLTQYDNDFEPGSENGFKYQVKAYPNKDAHFEVTLSSGVRMRMKYMDGYSELKVLDAAEGDSISLNTAIYSRDPQAWVSGEWQNIQRLNFASKKDSIIIQAAVANDAQSLQFTECNCPKCKAEWVIPFNKIKDFFFPSEI